MISRLKKLLSSQQAGDSKGEEETLRLAAGALLMEAACMDGHIDDAELETVTSLLADQFKLTEAEASELAEAARKEVSQCGELYGFTRTLKDEFDHDQRVRMIEMMWHVAYADGELHDFEANLLRRASGLLYVSDRESGEARKRVLERLDLGA